MSNYLNLVGLPYIDGRQDCYSVCRRYYADVWGIELPNFARPNRFWDDPNMDLYSRYADQGFAPVFDGVYKTGDAVLMPLLSRINSHAGVVVDDNKLLHHLPNQLSSVDPLRPKWSNRVTVHLRHPKITEALEATQEVVHIHEVIDADILRDPRIKEAIAQELERNGGTVRSDHAEPGDPGETEPVAGS